MAMSGVWQGYCSRSRSTKGAVGSAGFDHDLEGDPERAD